MTITVLIFGLMKNILRVSHNLKTGELTNELADHCDIYGRVENKEVMNPLLPLREVQWL